MFADVIQLAETAGAAILDIYRREDFKVETKSDNSPVTQADLAAHHIIVEGLRKADDDLGCVLGRAIESSHPVGRGLAHAKRGSAHASMQPTGEAPKFIPILSEESTHTPWSERRTWTRYWLVDPLDGTKEFINRSDDFTVNIALIENGEPVWGVIHAPVRGLTWAGGTLSGKAMKSNTGGTNRHTIHTATPPGPLPVGGVLARAQKDSTPARVTDESHPVGGGLGHAPADNHPVGGGLGHAPAAGRPWKILASRSHRTPAFDDYIRQFDNPDILTAGSSLKMCLVAEGSADLYPRFGPTSEWDTAAGHAILRAAGGDILNLHTGEPLNYNQQESLTNPDFLCLARAPIFRRELN